jgi:hypothetical protein
MNRHELFLFELQTLLIQDDCEARKTLECFQHANDPNVKTMIMQGVDETVEKKVLDYFNYKVNGGPKPHWFVLSSEGPI